MYQCFFVRVHEVYPDDGRHRRCSYVKVHGVISQKTVFRRNVGEEIHQWENTAVKPKKTSRCRLRLRTGKSKVVPLHAMKPCSGSRGMAPQFLNLSSRWEWLTSRIGHFTSGKGPRLGGPQSQYLCFREEKNFLTLPGFEPLAIQPVA